MLQPSNDEHERSWLRKGFAHGRVQLHQQGGRIIGASSPESSTPQPHSPTLASYGYKSCPWMAEPLETRYPRTRKPQGAQWYLWKCIEHLVKLQERGELIFLLFGGTGLSASTMGGFHGNGDDDDVDIKLYSRFNADLQAHCDGVGTLGEYGFAYWAKTENATAVQTREETWQIMANESSPEYKDHHRAISNLNSYSPCVCEWEDLSVLCMEKPSYWTSEYGGSWWVPLPTTAGFKDTGTGRFEGFFNPDHSAGTLTDVRTPFTTCCG